MAYVDRSRHEPTYKRFDVCTVNWGRPGISWGMPRTHQCNQHRDHDGDCRCRCGKTTEHPRPDRVRRSKTEEEQ